MDYKEKYEQALSKARQFSEKPLLEDSAGIVEYIFPELKEPELAELKDERIMKALIHFFSNDENTSFEYWEGIPKAEVLAWLEKQGQVKESVISQHENKTCKENDDSLTSEDEMIRKEIRDFICWSTDKGCITKEQVEKSNSWLTWLASPVLSNSSSIGMKSAEESLGIDSDAYNEIVDECIYGDDKQKPAWSEEDERIRQCLIRDQEEALDDVRNDKYGHSEIISDLKEMYRERIDWLKSLKDRVQPTLAWNENDEVALESAATNFAQDKYLPVQTAQAFKAGAAWQRQQLGSKE